MPAKKDSETAKQPAAKPRRARKVAVKPAAAASAAPRRRTAPKREAAAAAPPPPVETPVITSVPTPLLPVSPRGPASAEAQSSARPAAPVPTTDWHWTRPPLAATVAFLATLGALMLGYWTGYSVANGTSEPAVTVAEASEKTPTMSPEPPILTELTGAPDELEAPEAVEPQPAQLAAEVDAPSSGLHLQVSALSSQTAASELQRQLESHGYPVRIEQPSEDELVRVYVGPISENVDVSVLAAELRKEGLKPFPKRL